MLEGLMIFVNFSFGTKDWHWFGRHSFSASDSSQSWCIIVRSSFKDLQSIIKVLDLFSSQKIFHIIYLFFCSIDIAQIINKNILFWIWLTSCRDQCFQVACKYVYMINDPIFKNLTLSYVLGRNSMRFCEFQPLSVWQQFQNKLASKSSAIMNYKTHSLCLLMKSISNI